MSLGPKATTDGFGISAVRSDGKRVLTRASDLVLDGFKVAGPSRSFLLTALRCRIYVGSHTIVEPAGNLVLRSFSGASVRRVIDRSHACVPEHAHDWPVLSLFVIGSYLNETEVGENFISGPSAVFYRAGARHRNTTAAVGFEQIEIEFDPSWLGRRVASDLRPSCCGSEVASAGEARHLAHACQQTHPKIACAALKRFLEGASREPRRAPASWIGTMSATPQGRHDPENQRPCAERYAGIRHGSDQRIGTQPEKGCRRLQLDSVSNARRACYGRPTNHIASIALEAGFCDQSHMNRTFRRVLGRSPAAVGRSGGTFDKPRSDIDRYRAAAQRTLCGGRAHRSSGQKRRVDGMANPLCAMLDVAVA